jgi:hypothetical protein
MGVDRIINISGIAGISVLGPALTHGFNNSAMNHVRNIWQAILPEIKSP